MTLMIPQTVIEAIFAQAHRELPNECCGFLIGKEYIERVLLLKNLLASPVAYEVEASELLRVQRELRTEGLEILAIYHSHPTSAAVPSLTDLARNGYGETIPHVIIGMADSPPDVRAWILGDRSYREVAISAG